MAPYAAVPVTPRGNASRIFPLKAQSSRAGGRGAIVNQAYAIADDFLSQQDHLGLWDAFQASVDSPAGMREWNRFYQLMDGEDLVTSTFRQRRPLLRDGTANSTSSPAGLRTFSEKLFALMTADRPPLPLDAWTAFSASAWIHRAGSGLAWHSDTGRVAAYIYYMHPQWRSSWGGELLVATGGSSSDAAASRPGDPTDAEQVCATGGVFIYPRPNRLVLLRGGTLHCVKNVERAAGTAIRASVSGFFFDTAAGRDETGAGGRT